MKYMSAAQVHAHLKEKAKQRYILTVNLKPRSLENGVFTLKCFPFTLGRRNFNPNNQRGQKGFGATFWVAIDHIS